MSSMERKPAGLQAVVSVCTADVITTTLRKPYEGAKSHISMLIEKNV